jgi:hypothetical protein
MENRLPTPTPSDDAIDALQAIINVLAAKPDLVDPGVKGQCWRRLRHLMSERARRLGHRDAA